MAEKRFPGSGIGRVLGPKPVLSPNLDIIVIIIFIIVPIFITCSPGTRDQPENWT